MSSGKSNLATLLIIRAPDFAIVTLLLYALSTLVPPLPSRVALSAHFLHALSWRVFHSFGLGLLLRAQSKSKWLVRHYLKHYHYPGDSVEEDDVATRATEEAFGNWQVMYNMSLVMTYGKRCEKSSADLSVVCGIGMEDVSSTYGLDC